MSFICLAFLDHLADPIETENFSVIHVHTKLLDLPNGVIKHDVELNLRSVQLIFKLSSLWEELVNNLKINK